MAANMADVLKFMFTVLIFMCTKNESSALAREARVSRPVETPSTHNPRGAENKKK